MEDETPWSFMMTNSLAKFPEPHIKNLIFQYDILRPFLRSAKVHQRDHALEILDTADRLTLLTLWHSPAVLQKTWAKDQIAEKIKLGNFFRKKRNLLLHKELQEPSKVHGFYKSWFHFTRTKPGNHHIVSLEKGVRVYTLEEWEKLTRAYDKEYYIS
jgi:hypothetical protein